jgi:hypothetical protein
MSIHSTDRPVETAEREEWSPVRWALKAWIWIVLLVLALLAELFAGPSVAALVLALKFGGADMALGIWVRRRGALALGFFAWAQAFLKIAIAGFVFAVVITALEPLFGVPFDPEKFIWALVLLTGGVFLTMVATYTAAAVVHHGHHHGRYRLWLDRSAYGDLLANRWPLSCNGMRNRIPGLLILGILSTAGFSLVCALVCVQIGWRKGEWEPGFAAAAIVGLGTLLIWQDLAALREVSERELALQAMAAMARYQEGNKESGFSQT